MIVLNSHETIRECFQKRKEFCESIPPTFNYFLNFDDGKITFNDIHMAMNVLNQKTIELKHVMKKNRIK